MKDQGHLRNGEQRYRERRHHQDHTEMWTDGLKSTTTFPVEHMFTIVIYDLRPNASKHHIRVYVCLTTQFAFFSLFQQVPVPLENVVRPSRH